MISETAALIREDVPNIPLHQQQIVWAVRNGWTVVSVRDDWSTVF